MMFGANMQVPAKALAAFEKKQNPPATTSRTAKKTPDQLAAEKAEQEKPVARPVPARLRTCPLTGKPLQDSANDSSSKGFPGRIGFQDPAIAARRELNEDGFMEVEPTFKERAENFRKSAPKEPVLEIEKVLPPETLILFRANPQVPSSDQRLKMALQLQESHPDSKLINEWIERATEALAEGRQIPCLPTPEAIARESLKYVRDREWEKTVPKSRVGGINLQDLPREIFSVSCEGDKIFQWVDRKVVEDKRVEFIEKDLNNTLAPLLAARIGLDWVQLGELVRNLKAKYKLTSRSHVMETILD